MMRKVDSRDDKQNDSLLASKKNSQSFFQKHLSWKNSGSSSVSRKLNFVNILVIISGILSIIGAYEIHMGAKMHGLNYLHQKYITELVKTVKTFETGAFEANIELLEPVEKSVLLIRQQPIDCLDLIGPMEAFVMALIDTANAINVCQDDLQIANDLIVVINAYRSGEIDKYSLLSRLHKGIEDFEESGVKFEPLVVKTVAITFFVVITIVIGKAFIVPMFGLLLSRSVARDYYILLRTKANLEKEKQHSTLIQSERMASLNTLVAGIAHEVNTPVGVSITANSHSQEILNQIHQAYKAESLTEEDFREFFKEMEEVNRIISDNLARTSTLINSFKMISVDQSVEKSQHIYFKSYIEQILISLSPLTKKSGISINLRGDENIQGDTYGGALVQVITNIVTNTISHAFKDREPGTLSIAIFQRKAGEVQLSFEDNGRGIPEIDLLHVFEPFFTTGRGQGGTGLGLHILHNLVVDKLKGHVSCTSKLGQGARFDIYLPVEQPLVVNA